MLEISRNSDSKYLSVVAYTYIVGEFSIMKINIFCIIPVLLLFMISYSQIILEYQLPLNPQANMIHLEQLLVISLIMKWLK